MARFLLDRSWTLVLTGRESLDALPHCRAVEMFLSAICVVFRLGAPSLGCGSVHTDQVTFE